MKRSLWQCLALGVATCIPSLWAIAQQQGLVISPLAEEGCRITVR
jgi:hypothetical protein